MCIDMFMLIVVSFNSEFESEKCTFLTKKHQTRPVMNARKQPQLFKKYCILQRFKYEQI